MIFRCAILEICEEIATLLNSVNGMTNGRDNFAEVDMGKNHRLLTIHLTDNVHP